MLASAELRFSEHARLLDRRDAVPDDLEMEEVMIDMEWVLPDGYDPAIHTSTLYWIIVYPVGDRTKVTVAEMCDATDYEENDYSLASRKRFRSKQMAIAYCRELAVKHGLVCDLARVGDDFLD